MTESTVSFNTGPSPMTALVLPGGGARSAYQAGVLKAIAEMGLARQNPFPIMCGVSAGAINVAAMASHAEDFSAGVDRLGQFWSSMHCDRIYRTDGWTVLRNGLHWLFSLTLGGRLIGNPRSLLDNEPLRHFLEKTLQLEGIDSAIAAGALHAVAVTASGYKSASAVTFFQGQDDLKAWNLPRREGRKSSISVSHLLASAALPLIFPAEQVGHEYFGDGGMRMLTPLSPAINLGASKVLVIGTRDEHPDPPPLAAVPYPSLGEIGGYLLDCIFMDTLQSDLQILERNNQVVNIMPADQREQLPLRFIEHMVIRPSQDLRDLTREHMSEVPAAVRLLLRNLGGWGKDWRLASYLLFESGYCQALLDLGYQDGLAQGEKLQEFLQPAAK